MNPPLRRLGKSQAKVKEVFVFELRLTKVKKLAPATYEAALEQFLIWKKAQGISKQTMKDYKEHVSRVFRRYPEASKPEAAEVLEKSEYDYLDEDGIKPAIYNNRLVYLSTFFNWKVSDTQYPTHVECIVRLERKDTVE